MILSLAASVASSTELTFLLCAFLGEELVHEHELLIFLPLFALRNLALLLVPDALFALSLIFFVTADALLILLLAYIDVLRVFRLIDF